MQPEAKLVKQIRSYLTREGAWSAKIHGGDNPFQEIGLPDLFVIYRGYAVGLEVKVPGEEHDVSPRQLLVLKRMREAGAIAEVVSSVAQVDKILKRITRK
jgi:hypothetical protein